ncbi:hypothetical protein M9Y10_044679 [Tritrichomonas musculus]|uniref:Uncharacterized protein n=1 Tax=Tritrichomonas musculus TaxID=1915356 RepID=A0ABR2JTG1_9EUKA
MNAIKEDNMEMENELYFNHLESEYDDSEDDSFDIDAFVQKINTFNSAVKEENCILTLKSVEDLIEQVANDQDSGSDPDLLDYFDYSIFYLSCIKCLYINYDDLILQVIKMLGLLAKISTGIGDSLYETKALLAIFEFVSNRPLSPQLISQILSFIYNVSLTSYQSRILMAQKGVFNFFSDVLRLQLDCKVIKDDLECIRAFFTHESFADISSPQFDQLMIALKECLNNIFSNQFQIEINESEKNEICLFIVNIFNIYVGAVIYPHKNLNSMCSHFLELQIPISLYTILENTIEHELASLIVSNINQLILYGKDDLVSDLISKMSVNIFANFCDFEDLKISEESLNIIECLIRNKPDGILILMQINFYNQMIEVIDNTSFKIQSCIISIILVSIFNATSSEIIGAFVNEKIIYYLLEYLDITKFKNYQLIPSTLLRIKELIPPNESISIDIENALQNSYPLNILNGL